MRPVRCTASEIMAVLGHKSMAEAERYTRGADGEKLTGSAMDKLERVNREQGCPAPAKGAGKRR